MSRIHDALMRAQQERALTEVATPERAPVPASAEASVAVDVAPPPVEMYVESTPQSPPAVASNGNLTYELLASRSTQHSWRIGAGKGLSEVDGTSPGLEEFRALRTRLYQLRGTMPLKVVLIASALPGEGKTFISANLAQIMVRQRGRRALLIDGDLRIPRLHKEFETAVSPGLTEYLKGEADEAAIMQRGPVNGLLFIPGGRNATNPAELLAGNGLRRLLDRVGHCFDWIFIDSPAALPIADASVLAGVCDGVLMVVKAAETPFDLAQKARQEFAHSRVVGVVLNRVASKSSYTSYYYQSYASNREPSQG
jgi:protein-tyrosine kinase